jgi:hypothetical protein
MEEYMMIGRPQEPQLQQAQMEETPKRYFLVIFTDGDISDKKVVCAQNAMEAIAIFSQKYQDTEAEMEVLNVGVEEVEML